MNTRTRLVWLVVVTLTLSLTVGGTGQAQTAGNAAKRLIGTWRLVSYLRNGQPLPNEGPRPTGLIYYDATGHMAAQVMPDRDRPGWTNRAPTPDEAKAAVLGYVAYFGTYSVNERDSTVTHHHLGRRNPGRGRFHEFVSAATSS